MSEHMIIRMRKVYEEGYSVKQNDDLLTLKRSESSLSRFPLVEANINKDDSLKLYRSRQRIRKNPHQAISINEAPIMLLPKARVRTDYDPFKTERPYSVIPAEDYNKLHLSAVVGDSVRSVSRGSLRSPSRSSLKSRTYSRSDDDSGVGSSIRRCVTFDELSLSRSTVTKSLDELDRTSEVSDVNNNQSYDVTIRDEKVDRDVDDVPDYLDSFGDILPVPPKIPRKSKPEKRKCSVTADDIERCHEQNCDICKGLLSEKERILKHFSGVDQFLNWLYSKWGKKRRELSGLQRKPQLLRTVSGPRFCNIVKQKEIHKREKEEDSDEYGDGKFDYYRQNVNSPLITRWRKHSNASTTQEDIVNQIVNDMREPAIPEQPEQTQEEEKGGKGGTEGRPGSPSSQLGLDNDHGQEASDTAEIKSSDDSDSKQIIPTKIDFPESKLDNSSDKPPMHLSHVIRVDITGKSPTELESNKTKNTSTTELNKITSVKDEPQETPKQPPPSPEPIPPKETIQVEISTPSVDKEKKRASISKKTKQSVQKVRKPKEEMEEKKEEPPVVPTPPPEPPKPEESPNKDIKVEVDLPSLPALQEEKKEKKKKNKAERHLVTQPKHEPPKIDPEELLDEQLKLRLKNFDFNMMEMGITEESPRKTTNKPSWNTGRLALSQQSSRFELPMDMKKLEQMSALEYIKSFCIISSRRRKLYYDIFTRHKEKQSNAIIYKDLEKALKSVLVNTLTSDHYHEIVDLLDITQQTKVDLDTFAAISALSERLLCTTYVTQEQVDMPDYQKDKIECADFSALDWKLHGVNASPKIVKLLKQLS